MKILLVDVDSKIPNLALMKLSTYYADHDVELMKLGFNGYPRNTKPVKIEAIEYDKVFVSIVFSVNSNKVTIENCSDVQFGGSGYDIYSCLPEHIDSLDEDYSLYPENNYSYGFITRGCSRNCSFCIVPRKEGKIRFYRDWRKIVRHKRTYFLDNNILAYPDHKQVLLELATEKVACQFNQGLDIRLLDDENSYLLSEMNYVNDYIFAFDNIRYEKMVQKGLDLFQRYFDREWRIKMFIYCHPDMSLDDVIYRINWCRDRKVFPYLMRDQACWNSQHKSFYIDLAAYCNQSSLKYLSFSEFMAKRYSYGDNNEQRINDHINLWEMSSV
jgi:hypothetical protein